MDADTLHQRLAELAQKYRVPGASVALLAHGQVTEAAHGVLNLATDVGVTSDSLFQIGSITKVYTATQIMRLVDQGTLSLDEPLVTYLPEFGVSDPDVTKQVTIRHLLTHTSGIDGDHFLDTGRGDDCLERYVASLAEVGQNHPLGATMSYCNAGYSTLGRLLEVVAGKLWDTTLAEQLIQPLGLERTMTLPEDVLRYRGALGHLSEAGADPKPSPVWGLMRSCGPAGLVCASAADVIAFARLHLDGGVAADGTRLLSEQTVAAMQQPQVAVPDRWTLGDHWGLGWILFNWEGRPVYGHDGNTIGQSAYLRIVPDAGVAVALLTNGGDTGELYRALYGELLGELAGVQPPPPPVPPAEPVDMDLESYAGRYERTSSRIEAAVVDGALRLTMTVTGALAKLVPNPVQEMTLVPVDAEQHLFVTRAEPHLSWTPVVFFTLPDGSRYIHMGARATPKRD